MAVFILQLVCEDAMSDCLRHVRIVLVFGQHRLVVSAQAPESDWL